MFNDRMLWDENPQDILEKHNVDIERFLQRPDVKIDVSVYECGQDVCIYDVAMKIDGAQPQYAHCDNPHFFAVASSRVRAIQKAIARFYVDFIEKGGM